MITARLLDALVSAEQEGRYIIEIVVDKQYAREFIDVLDTVPGYTVVRDIGGSPTAVLSPSPISAWDLPERTIQFLIYYKLN